MNHRYKKKHCLMSRFNLMANFKFKKSSMIFEALGTFIQYRIRTTLSYKRKNQEQKRKSYVSCYIAIGDIDSHFP